MITYSPGASPDDARKALEAMAARIRDMRPILVPGAEMLHQVITLGFETSTAPDGTPWAPNADGTIARKRGSSKPNIDSTRLKRSAAARAVGLNTIEIGSNVPYAGPVQFGSTRSGKLKNGSRSALTTAALTKSGKKSKTKRVGIIGPRQERAAGTPWKVTIPPRPFLPFSPTGGLTSSGPAGAALQRLSAAVVKWITTGNVTI